MLDVTPTVLRLLGLPVGADMSGRPWLEIIDRPLESHRILSWELLEGQAGMPLFDSSQDSMAAKEALKQLIDLGYVDPPSQQAQNNVEEVLGWQKYNLATALQFSGRHDEMMALFREMPAKFQALPSVKIRTIISLISMGRISEAEELLATLDSTSAQSPQVLMFKGTIARLRGDLSEALTYYQQVESFAPHMPGLHERLGSLYLAMKHYADAKRAYESALQLDADSAVAFDGLSQAAIGQMDWGGAVDMALEALARVYQFPRAHLHLAMGLHRLGDIPRAIDAVERALAQSSEYRQAHELAAILYHLAGRDKEAYEQKYLAGQCPGPTLVGINGDSR
ncbi:MAG: tetratricopeptide repeat protein [Phycisphaerales bacterium]|nr:tetratricopeptide repeat protein [Phycisphaerales bacterium]